MSGMLLNGRKRANGKGRQRSGLIAALDLGTTKICCLIARVEDDGAIKVVGIGHQRSAGLRGGAIVDMEQAEQSIRAAVDTAEKMVDTPINAVTVNLAGGQPESHSLSADVAIAGHQVGETDLRRVFDHGRSRFQTDGRELIHTIPVRFSIDEAAEIRDPRGMYGDRLGVDLHLITASSSAVRNLTTCVSRCHLDVGALALSPFASGLAALVEDEKELGTTVIDMGGGTTGIAVFRDGRLLLADSLPVGGNHVTNDIARGLTTPVANAERMKTLYGSVIGSPRDDQEVIAVPLVGEEDEHHVNQVPRSMLVSIIRPRIEETLEMVRARLEDAGVARTAGRRVVLTGGASQLQGVRDLAAQILDKQVRIGRPLGFAGLTDATGGPAFATCAGLLSYAAHSMEDRAFVTSTPEEAAGPIGRLGAWLRDNL